LSGPLCEDRHALYSGRVNGALLLVLTLSSGLDVMTVPGAVHDVVLDAADPTGGIWFSRTKSGRRELVRTDGRKVLGDPFLVPSDVVSVDACGAHGVVLQDRAGLRDLAGKRLLEGEPLLSHPDPQVLYAAQLCRGDELRLVTRGGLLVAAPGRERVLLPFAHRARLYSGEVHRGLRPRRAYGAAVSLYAPRMIDADVDGDGAADLVLVHESRIKVFYRRAGALTALDAVERDLASIVGAPADDDVRVLVHDLDGDKRAELIVGTSNGPVPDRSSGWRVRTNKRAFDRAPELLWQEDGLVAPVGAHPAGLVVASVDTSVVAIGAAILTGEVPLKIRVGRGPTLELTAIAGLRSGRMAGALPMVDTDLTGDGRNDLLDLGTPGRARLFMGTRAGYGDAPTSSWNIPAFVHVVQLGPRAGVALVGKPGVAQRGGFVRTRVAILRPERARARAPRRR
jgi:hypothetical protein